MRPLVSGPPFYVCAALQLHVGAPIYEAMMFQIVLVNDNGLTIKNFEGLTQSKQDCNCQAPGAYACWQTAKRCLLRRSCFQGMAPGVQPR